MEIVQEKIGSVRVLRLRGRLDLAAKPGFESLMKGLIEGGENRIVLDCQELKYVSSSGLGAFIVCGRQLAGSGELVFAGLSSHIESLFEMTGISGLFTLCKTEQDALAALGVAAG
jgi:anti-sigma B factor antagonist